MDIEAELVKRRYKKGRDLFGERNFKEAIPHLRRTLDAVKGASEGPIYEDAPQREEIQMILATAMTKIGPESEEAESILRIVFDSQHSKPLEKFSAAHLLAQMLFTKHPEDCAEAKSICLSAVKGRNAILGRTDPHTYESIALLTLLCQISKDSEEAIWRDMLPDGYELHKLVLTEPNGSAGSPPSLSGNEHSEPERNISPAELVIPPPHDAFLVLRGHSKSVEGVAFSPNGKMIASCSADTTIRLWSCTTGELLYELKGHEKSVSDEAFSPDSKIVASGSDDNRIRLWSTKKGVLLRELTGHFGSVEGVEFSPDSKENAVTISCL